MWLRTGLLVPFAKGGLVVELVEPFGKAVAVAGGVCVVAGLAGVFDLSAIVFLALLFWPGLSA